MSPSIDADTRIAVEDHLARIDGVLYASVHPASGDIWIVHDPARASGPVELAARNALAEMGPELGNATLRIALPTPAGPKRRVRFIDASRREDPDGVTMTVRLEWNDNVHSGSASGERGPAVELKTTAQAAIDALEKVSGQSLGVRIIGVKQMHAFDSTLMVVSMIRTRGPLQRFVGAVIVGDDPIHSAAIAVLSGLNRTLGNFLHTAD